MNLTKVLLLFLAILPFSAQAGVPLVQCETMEIIEDWEESTGKPIFNKYQADLKVISKEGTKYGFQAIMRQEDGALITVEDTQFDSSIEITEDIHEMVRQFIESVNPQDIEKVSHANIGVKANLEDGSGIQFFSAYRSDGQLLAQFGTMGWTYFRCLE